MRVITCILLGLLIAVTHSHADIKLPYLKVGGAVYTNVTIIKVTATDINFMHARGLANAKLKDLSPELQQRFHFDSSKAANAQTQQSQANIQYQQQLNAPKPAATPAGQSSAQNRPPPDDVQIRVPRLYAKAFLNSPAPAFVVEKWLTPKPDLAGKFVLIDFWATWCSPCREAIPHLNGLFAKFKDKVAVVGLSDESEHNVLAMASPHIDYAIAIDPRQQMMRDVEVRGIPHAMLIDPKGIVRFEGMPEYLTEDGLERLLAKYGN